MNVVVVEHAVDRYIQRIDSSVSRSVAEALIRNAVASYEVMRSRTRQGHEIMKGTGFGVVVKRDGPDVVAVTVLTEEMIHRPKERFYKEDRLRIALTGRFHERYYSRVVYNATIRLEKASAGEYDRLLDAIVARLDDPIIQDALLDRFARRAF